MSASLYGEDEVILKFGKLALARRILVARLAMTSQRVLRWRGVQ